MRKELFIILFLFFIGAVSGWFIELFFRRFFSSKKWVNPGLLKGPWLPIYGFGIVFLYILSYFESFVIQENIFLSLLILFVVSMILMTLLELIGGLIFIKGMHIKLWDYSNEPFNYKGIICLRFSLMWGLISILYYFLINPYMVHLVDLYMQNIEFSLIVGLFYGFFLSDLGNSLHIATKIRKLAIDENFVIFYEEFKENLSEKRAELKLQHHFFFHPNIDQLKYNLEEFIKKKKG